MQLFTAKSLAIFFGLATIAFVVSTIVLAVQKSELQDELDDALDKLTGGTTAGTTSATTPTTPTISTISTPTNPTNPGDTTPSIDPGNTTPPTDPGNTTPPTDPGNTTPPTNPGGTTPSTLPTPVTVTTTVNPNFPVPGEILYRLPNHARPWKYQVYLNPNLEEGTYEGTVTIGINMDLESNVIALHSKDLDIFGISILQVMARMRIRIKDYYTDPTRELLIIELGEVLQLYTPYTLSISFRGSLNGLSGFYSSSYTDQNGEQK